MTEIEISRNVFNEVYIPHLENLARKQIYFGGSSSGKSAFLAQRTVFDILKGGRNYLVCRAVGKYIRKSVFNEIIKLIENWNLSHLFTINKSEWVITCSNGYQILFAGLDDTEKIKSITPAKGVLTDVWVEEATETNQHSIKQLEKRLRGVDAYTKGETPDKRLTMSFNPILQGHWIHQEYFTGWADDQREMSTDDLFILHTTYKDNRFLTAEDITALEDERDEYFYQVYTLGKWGVLGDVIFTNWKVQDLSGMMDQFTNHRHGLDFGFSSDPAAVLRTHYDRSHKTIYIYDEMYERGLTNDLLAEGVLGMLGQDYVMCDSSEPKSIAELKRYRVNARPVAKGKDSVVHGIQWLQQQEIIIHSGCANTIREFQQYQWRKDKDGNAIKQPVDRNNHAIDALRYAYEDEMRAAPEASRLYAFV